MRYILMDKYAAHRLLSLERAYRVCRHKFCKYNNIATKNVFVSFLVLNGIYLFPLIIRLHRRSFDDAVIWKKYKANRIYGRPGNCSIPDPYLSYWWPKSPNFSRQQNSPLWRVRFFFSLKPKQREASKSFFFHLIRPSVPLLAIFFPRWFRQHSSEALRLWDRNGLCAAVGYLACVVRAVCKVCDVRQTLDLRM